ncbi:glutenin, high molecular weight subunit PW212 [Folsomia candida]|uniref:Polyadenylate-binding protein, cytoplasmic and nuclear n=1 Tax=Folsomia candida TaxID=158441 RepID=A0A226D1S7_FOLCA|nr:glutenin, high molecular weight subunit PW212 [Folsomia candida]OXA38236.1 Polyadenylate-binding protein, cytoplasmic and nuclear [Folsomia candida]
MLVNNCAIILIGLANLVICDVNKLWATRESRQIQAGNGRLTCYYCNVYLRGGQNPGGGVSFGNQPGYYPPNPVAGQQPGYYPPNPVAGQQPGYYPPNPVAGQQPGYYPPNPGFGQQPSQPDGNRFWGRCPMGSFYSDQTEKCIKYSLYKSGGFG